MEIFCWNIPKNVTEKNLEKSFAPFMEELSIHTYYWQKRGHNCATLTLLEADKAQRLLEQLPRNKARTDQHRVQVFGKWVNLRRNDKAPDEFILRSLEEKELKRAQHIANAPSRGVNANRVRKSFDIISISCGIWGYAETEPTFINYFQELRSGTILFRKSGLKVSLDLELLSFSNYHIEFDYSSMTAPIYTGGPGSPNITISMRLAPKLVEEPNEAFLEILSLARSKPVNMRISSLGTNHAEVVSSCFTYRFTLKERVDLQLIHSLNGTWNIPKIMSWAIPDVQPTQPYPEQMESFLSTLKSQYLPYRIKFQLQVLVWNGILSLPQVSKLLPQVPQLVARLGPDTAAVVLQKLAIAAQPTLLEPGRSEADSKMLAQSIRDAEEGVRYTNRNFLGPGTRDPNKAYIQKATVTPTGIYLYGPYWESKNRVLRKYARYIDYFMRVEFTEETGDPIRFDQNASLDQIFSNRFKNILNAGIVVGDRRFEFLGFSNSSLRSHSCWFVAAFTTDDGQSVNAKTIIPELGNFSQIYSPARCAARIGQAFSETYTSIAISPDAVKVINDVERCGRIFSDGVGTMSTSIMHKIWDEYALQQKVKPTVFQIRFAGAKGMISLDNTIQGDILRLRGSMIKFEGSNSSNIEICGSGIRPLPLFLNRQLIKILEDLGVSSKSFMDLQQNEIDRLRVAGQSPLLAASFLKKSNLARSSRLPWLLCVMGGLGLHHSNDPFLKHAIELAIMVELRELKHRSRIYVERGVTLYGIMDETGYLQEDEVFCVVKNEKGEKEVVMGHNLIITRSPALHPGDVQLVNAVDVPTESPLQELHNCIVFSQKGSRDLPSKLSGGDLDGDLYNLIYDERLRPKHISQPAEYARAQEPDANVPVTKEAIIDFFLQFMQQDQLGRIAINHQILADQRPKGTFDKDCLILAELHSAAVDFSKTGKPANMSLLPRQGRSRPDFMAPGPRVKIAEDISLVKTSSTSPEGEEEEEEDDDDSGPRYLYYKSKNVLGELYRAIDEHSFLKELQSSTEGFDPDNPNVLSSLWEYVKYEIAGFQWQHHCSAAEDIKEMYEDNLTDILYQYSGAPWSSSLTELEVFIGNIIGKGHKQSKRQREASKSMREDYEELVELTISLIRNSEEENGECLERSVACFWVAVDEQEKEQRQEQSQRRKGNRPKLRSFRWIAAATCLQEVDKLQKSTGRKA